MRKRMTLRRILAPKPAPQIVQKPKAGVTPKRSRLRGVETPYEALAGMQTGPMSPGGVRLIFHTDNENAVDTLENVRETLYAWQPHPSQAFGEHGEFWIPVLFEDVEYGAQFVVRYITVDREGQRELRTQQVFRGVAGPRMRFHVRQRFELRGILNPDEPTMPDTVTVFELGPHHIVFLANQTSAGIRGNFAGIY